MDNKTPTRLDLWAGSLEYVEGVRTASADNSQYQIPAEAVRTLRVYSNLPGVQPRRNFVWWDNIWRKILRSKIILKQNI